MRWVGELSSGRLTPAPTEHVVAPDPPQWYVSSTRVGDPDGREEVPDLYEWSGIFGGWLGASLPQGHVASLDPSQSGERARGCWPGEVRACPVGPGCYALYRVVTDDYASPALRQ